MNAALNDLGPYMGAYGDPRNDSDYCTEHVCPKCGGAEIGVLAPQRCEDDSVLMGCDCGHEWEEA